jgi:hypothetical protein
MATLIMGGEYIDNFIPAHLNPYLMFEATPYIFRSFVALETTAFT